MTKIIAEKKTGVKSVRAVVTVFNQEKRPEITYLLKNIELLDLHKGEKDNLKRYLSDLKLFDQKMDRITESGRKTLLNDMVTVPQSGLYQLSYVLDPVPGVNSQIIDYTPEKPVPEIIKDATRSMAEYRYFEGVEFISWNKDLTQFRVEFERSEGNDPRVIDTKEIPAIVTISGNAGNDCDLEIKTEGLSYQDKMYANFSIEDNIRALIPEYDKSLDAVKVSFSDIRDDQNAVHTFRKKIYATIGGKTLIFNTGNDDDRWDVRIEDVGLIPKSELDAEEWTFSLATENLNKEAAKFYFGMDYCYDICQDQFRKTSFSRAFPDMMLDFRRFRKYLKGNALSIFSDIQIAEDLCPEIPADKSDFGVNATAYADNLAFTEGELEAILNSGEDEQTEFKETFFGIDFGDEKSSSIFQGMKTIAAFMNSSGGNLLIGVSDDGGIKGITGDYRIVNKNPKKGNQDVFKLRFDQEFEKHIGNSFCGEIRMDFLSINGKDVCRIRVTPLKAPVHIKSQFEKTEKFFVRKTASTVELRGSEMTNYILRHFNGR